MVFNVKKTAVILATFLSFCFVFSDNIISVDYSFDNIIAPMRDDGGFKFWGVITAIGGKYSIIVLAILFSYILWILPKDNRRNFKIYWLFFFLQAGTGYLLKNIVGRDRPLGAELLEGYTYSFPSGHSLTAFFFFGFLIYTVYRYFEISNGAKNFLYIFLSLFIFLIGFSRLYLGVHYLSDVLGGYILGWFWLNFAINILKSDHVEKRVNLVKVSS